MDPEAFLRLLSKDLGVAGVVVGEGFRFGYKAAGDTEFLARRGAQLGMEVIVLGFLGTARGNELEGARVGGLHPSTSDSELAEQTQRHRVPTATPTARCASRSW